MKEHILVGRTITNVLLAEDKKAMLFKTDGGDVIARADGDCCSSTWIEGVETPAAGFPAKVSAVENLSGLPEEQGEYGEVTAHYGCKISTDKGDIVIDYRNASNGYYGGNLVWPVEPGEYDYFYGGVYGQNISNNDWRELQ